ncbi:MAG: hypothetical protein ACO1TE_17225 [Prosthecobacter sp.]
MADNLMPTHAFTETFLAVLQGHFGDEAAREQAIQKYKTEAVVDGHMEAIEEIINSQTLVQAFEAVVKSGKLQAVMDEIVNQMPSRRWSFPSLSATLPMCSFTRASASSARSNLTTATSTVNWMSRTS